MTTADSDTPWDADLPPAESEPTVVKPELIRSSVEAWQENRGFYTLLLDVRSGDYKGGSISGSLAFPVERFWSTFRMVYKLASTSKAGNVVFYDESDDGRARRLAAVFADYAGRVKGNELDFWALEGGLKGWVAGGYQYTDLMYGYDEDVWKQ